MKGLGQVERNPQQLSVRLLTVANMFLQHDLPLKSLIPPASFSPPRVGRFPLDVLQLLEISSIWNLKKSAAKFQSYAMSIIRNLLAPVMHGF